MKYQLRYLLHQLEHRKMVQVQETGLVEEWVFPLEKAVRQALESLEQEQVVKDWHRPVGQVTALEQAEGLESGYWKPQSQQ